jgi:glycosyltransferase involved in cell wall biosynthesis
MNIKVLHIVSGDMSGGASRGAYILHQGLIRLGVDSKILINRVQNLGDDRVINATTTMTELIKQKIRSRLDLYLAVLFGNGAIFSTGLVGFDFTRLQEYKDADIVNLHWINDGFVDIKLLSYIKKPIVWTMRDMWPMTGGCHYSLECQNYKNGCGNCKQLTKKFDNDLSRFIHNRKKKFIPKNIKLVGISRWLSNCAKESSLFKDFDVRMISNAIKTEEFFAIDKSVARNILGINTSKKVILTGSSNAEDFYKGFNKFIEAVKTLDRESYFLCFFGMLNKSLIDEMGFEYKSFGYLHDSASLRLTYSCADVFVAPSLMEAFGKTIAESMVCGTPVVCFDATGPKDIVSHQVNGYCAVPFDSLDLARGIEWILSYADYEMLVKNCIKIINEKFDSKVIAKQYVDLYKEIISVNA